MTVINETPQPNLNQVVTELAKLSPLEYDQVREDKAKELNVRIGTLDKVVASERAEEIEDSISIIEELTPWEETISGDELLNEIARNFARYVYLPSGAVTALAAWSLGTYCMESWSIWPKLLITSPEKRCGKSTLLDALEAHCYRSLVASNISPSAIYRCIEAWQPTLILDEADTFTKDNDELNGIINAGHSKRRAKVVRSEKSGDDFTPKTFSVWAAQVIAGIGNQRDTLHDRSIHIEMERKLPDEQIQKIPHDLFERCQVLRRKCIRWAIDNQHQLKQSIDIPNHGNDRAQDNWEPLVRIALLAGGQWEEKILQAYKLFSVQETEEDAGIILLRDIQQILKAHHYENIFSSYLVDRLIEIEDSPWFEWKKGKPLTQNSLARLLKPFKIISTTVRVGTAGPSKGYKKSQFENVFDRYIPPKHPKKPISSVTTLQTAPHKASEPIQDVTRHDDVTFQSVTRYTAVTDETARQPLQDKGCNVVTDENPKKGHSEGYAINQPSGGFEL